MYTLEFLGLVVCVISLEIPLLCGTQVMKRECVCAGFDQDENSVVWIGERKVTGPKARFPTIRILDFVPQPDAVLTIDTREHNDTGNRDVDDDAFRDEVTPRSNRSNATHHLTINAHTNTHTHTHAQNAESGNTHDTTQDTPNDDTNANTINATHTSQLPISKEALEKVHSFSHPTATRMYNFALSCLKDEPTAEVKTALKSLCADVIKKLRRMQSFWSED